MEFKRTVFLTTVVVALGLLLGTGAAQAAEMIWDPDNSYQAIGITDLVVGENIYDVSFTEKVQPEEAYGPFESPEFDFDNAVLAFAAAVEVARQLSGVESGREASSVGAETEDTPEDKFFIGVSMETNLNGDPFMYAWQGFRRSDTGVWFASDPPPQELYPSGTFVFAKFTLTGDAQRVTIGGTVTGLGLFNGGLVLQNNGRDDLPIDADGPFEFVISVIVGEPYDVTVLTNPPGQACTVENGSGVAPDVKVTNVVVACGDTVTLGGTVAGNDSILLLEYNDFADWWVQRDNGYFTFHRPLLPGDSYDVSVYFEPPGQDCIVANGSGVASTEDVTNVAVACGDSSEPVTIGGTVTGLEGSDLVLQNNGTDDELIDADGDFTFDTPLQTGGIYEVTVLTNPTNPAQECFVAQGSGFVPYEDVTNVAVICGPAAEPVTIGGTVTGFEGSDLVLQNNGTDDELIDADGDFTFDTPLQTGSTYSVTVLTNPTNPEQDCFVARGSGTVLYEDVTSVAVICAPPDDGPPPPDQDTVCTRELCEVDEDLQEECETFLAVCLEEEAANEDECVGGALLICGELDLF